jgi:imidazole glycerol-phosphate synthase subunit HisH
MTAPTFRMLDYGAGNLHSLRKALEAAGAKVEVSADAATLAGADVAVLPGVGAFGPVMGAIGAAGEALRDRHADGLPILGVCIGQQVLYRASEEAPGVAGIGVFEGTVRRLPATEGKVPHMGWNQLDPGRDALFEGVPPGSFAYFVHSYAAPPDAQTVATSRYGMVFSAAQRKGNTLALQFHPEKSSAVGAAILRNAVAILAEAA